MTASKDRGSVDAIVVGAGLAGLAAARALADGGASVAVIEARDRVGGRTFSQAVGGGGERIDLGGQWIGPGHTRMYALAAELGIPTFAQFESGRKVLDLGGKISSYRGTIPSLPPWTLAELQWFIAKSERMAKTVPTDRPWDAPRARDYDARTVADLQRRMSHKLRAVFDVALRTIFGAEAGELSLLHFLFYLRSNGGLMKLIGIKDGAQQDRFVGGAQSIAEGLAGKLGERVIRSAPVRAISVDDAGVAVRCDPGTWRARRAIVAVPPALAGRIEYAPLLPTQRDQLSQRAPMAGTVKCIAFYERPFWRERGFSGEAVSDRGPAAAVFDDCGPDPSRQPALLGFVVGENARRWSARPAAERRRALLDQLARLHGDAAATPVHYVEQDWAEEQWTRGCPIGLLGPGTLWQYGPSLRAPCGPIHWAGTETATEWCGYMEGAVRSGERAAAEVLDLLGRGRA